MVIPSPSTVASNVSSVSVMVAMCFSVSKKSEIILPRW